MSIGEKIGILLGALGILVPILLTWYTLYAEKRGERAKRLTYEVSKSVPLATILPEETGIKLSLAYEKPPHAPIHVSSLYLTFVRVGNLGRLPIQASEIAPSDPIMLTVEEKSVFEMAPLAFTRPVSRIHVSGFRDDPERKSIVLGFDFLDYKDGILLRVLTENRSPRIRLTGTVIGQPEGIVQKMPLRVRGLHGVFRVLPIMAISALTVLTATANGFGHPLALSQRVRLIGMFFVLAITWTIIEARLDNILVKRQLSSDWPEALFLPEWVSQNRRKNLLSTIF